MYIDVVYADHVLKFQCKSMGVMCFESYNLFYLVNI